MRFKNSNRARANLSEFGNYLICHACSDSFLFKAEHDNGKRTHPSSTFSAIEFK